MFFRKKKKGDESRAELRRHYRRAPGKKHALGVKVVRAEDVPIAGELIDVSAGGAAVRFPADRDPELDPGERIRLSFTSLVHGGEVLVSAGVSSRRESSGAARYGFEFLDHEELFSQLDAYYFKFFNRRRCVRVRPALDTKLAATLAFGPGTMEVRINDISPDGFGITLGQEKARLLDEVEELTCTFRLPGTGEPFRWHARAIHLTPLTHGMLFGAVFLIPDTPEVAEQRRTLVDYCAKRQAEMALWDQAVEE